MRTNILPTDVGEVGNTLRYNYLLFSRLHVDIPSVCRRHNSLNTTVVESCPKPIIGFRLSCSGRIQKSAYAKPAEIADSLTVTQGVLPLNSFNHNIEFTQTSSTNAFGTCGIKV